MDYMLKERIKHVTNAIEQGETVKFSYVNQPREIKPIGFFGKDLAGQSKGFEGHDIKVEENEPNFRRFRFDSIKTFYGLTTRLDLDKALRESKKLTHSAKHLSYSTVELQVKLSNLAEDVGLKTEMEYMLNRVTEASHQLENAFFECDEVFDEAIARVCVQQAILEGKEMVMEEDDD